MHLIARFHAREGCEDELEQAIAQVAGPTRAEPGCLKFEAFQALRDFRLFFIHSTWSDEIAFERHAALPHTTAFVSRAEQLTDQPLEITRLSLRV